MGIAAVARVVHRGERVGALQPPAVDTGCVVTHWCRRPHMEALRAGTCQRTRTRTLRVTRVARLLPRNRRW